MHDVAIVGLGCRFPRAPDVCAFWELVRRGGTAFAPVPETRWKHARFFDPADSRNPEKTYTDQVALIDDIDAFAALHHGISPRRAQVMDPQHRLAIEVVREALQDAGWERRRAPDRERVGVYMGASTSEYRDLLGARGRALMMLDGAYGLAPEEPSAEAAVAAMVQDLVPTRAFTLPGSLLNMVAAAVSQTFDFGGPSFSIDAACASSLVAVHQAVRALRAGECDAAVAGGVYLALSPDAMVGFSRIGAISRSGVCRPLDRRADGFVLGEGLGVALLRRVEDARAAGDRIYAVIRGTGCVNDGRAEGPMAPRLEGQLRVLEQAYADARVPPQSVELLEVHGTATSVGDAVEVEALKQLWQRSREDGARALLTSVKASIGHTMSSAGIAGLIKASLALHHRRLPAQPGCEPDPALGLEQSPFRVSGEPAPWAPGPSSPRRAGVSSFGFGGTNVHVVLEEEPAPARSEAEELELFVLSAPTPELLRKHAGALKAAVAAQPELRATDVAHALATRQPMAARAAILARGRAELLERLEEVAAGDGPAAPMSKEGTPAALGRLWVSGAAVDLQELFGGEPRAMATLPPTPLETQRYWALERRPRAAPAPVLEAPVKAAPAAAPAPVVDPPGPPAPGREEGAPPRGASEAEVKAVLVESVARISAFPTSALKLEQSLVNDLGFDSLMLVELEADVADAWPAVRDLPRSLFGRETTIQQVISFVSSSLRGEALAAASTGEAPGSSLRPSFEAANAEPRLFLDLYRPIVTDAPDAIPEGDGIDLPGHILVTRDSHGIAGALVARLRAAGVQVVDDPDSGPLDGVIDLRGLDHSEPERERLQALLGLARRCSRNPSCFIAVTAMGGRFGLDGLPPDRLGDPIALGFTKALAREWPSARVKAVDVSLPPRPTDLAASLFEELRCTDRAAEVGLDGKRRLTVSLERAAASSEPIALSPDSVVLVSGGARGVGLKLAMALASRYRCRLALLGRTAPGPDTARALATLHAAGSRATYHQADVRSVSDVTAAATAARSAHGPITAVIHAAGVLADGPVRERDAQAALAVLETKLSGARALLEATRADPLVLFATISSWASRFGNAFQCDYSAANEAMNRLCATTPRGLSLLYPPWDGTEMVKGIPHFARQELEAAGVPFIDDAQGQGAFLAALDAGCSGEILLGRDLPDRICEHRTSTLLSIDTHPFLADHQIGGQPVLPLASAMDAAATAALASLGSTAGAFTLRSFRLHRGVVVHEPTRMEIASRWSERGGAPGDVSVEIHAGRALGPRSVAYRGVVSAPASTSTGAGEVPSTHPGAPSPLPLSLEDFYRSHTFHGPLLRGVTRIESIGPGGISGWVQGCSRSDWVKGAVGAWTIDPKVIDSSLQLAGYWAWVMHRRAGLPKGFQEHLQLHPFGPGPVRCVLSLEARAGNRLSGTIHYSSEDGQLLAVTAGAEAELLERDERFAPPLPPSPPPPSDISTDAYRIDHFPEYELLEQQHALGPVLGLENPFFAVHEGISGATTRRGGRDLLSFASYNYLGLSGHPAVSAAAKAAIDAFGTSVSASRIVSGEKPLHGELERALADFLGTEDAVAFVSGHATNVSAIATLVKEGDLVVHDALAHDSIVQGARLSGARHRSFPHGDWQALDQILRLGRGGHRRALVAVEGVYSMDGDLPDLPRIVEVARRHRALLMVDEAHSLGVLGRTGRGIAEHFGLPRSSVDVWMGTLSKSLAGCGGYVAGSGALVKLLRYRAPGFVFSVGMSPPDAAAALAALGELRAHPELVARLQQRARLFLRLARERGIDTGSSADSAIVPCIVRDSVHTVRLAQSLLQRGINAPPIFHPAVEEAQARIRFFITALHTDEQIHRAVGVLAEELAKLDASAHSTALSRTSSSGNR